ncbi:MAG TPA: glutamate formimidoyltransferase [bacterium (Candidatus Stahlbacteria)]|nr:glutamate formimidoyltransferase [Candidatus Stahlbacteria bacterium]
MAKLVECIPNFSEGRDPKIIDAIVNEITKVSGVKLTDRQMNADHNRAVITFVGSPEACKVAAFNACAKAKELIDLTKHKGEHPRIGATDVIPFVPISEVTMDECVEIARSLAKEIWEKLEIPTYLYEAAATRPDRENLANIRKGEFEGLREAVKTDPDRVPDFGKAELHPTAGATVVGARPYLIAYNVNLGTSDISIAKNIAKAIRFKHGGFRYVKALGFEIKERGIVQVSMNMTNYEGTPLFRAFEFIKCEAERYGVPVIGSEIVGVLPLKALVDVVDWYLRLENFKIEQILETKVWGEEEKIPKAFINEVASKSPAPGGGAVAALSGALGASLVSMVANLTIGKKKYAEVEDEMKRVLKESDDLKNKLTALIEEDIKAFNTVMDAYRMPKEDSEKRHAAIQKALKYATQTPLDVMRAARDVLKLAKVTAAKGNVNSISDAGGAALEAQTAIEGALFNVLINLGSLDDEKFKEETRKEVESIRAEANKLAEEVKAIVMSKL